MYETQPNSIHCSAEHWKERTTVLRLHRNLLTDRAATQAGRAHGSPSFL